MSQANNRGVIGWGVTALLMAVVVAGGCATGQATEADSEPAVYSVEMAEVPAGHEEGAMLYVKHCERCHDLYDPKRYSDFQWSWIMPWMARESNLDEKRSTKIEAYLKAAN